MPAKKMRVELFDGDGNRYSISFEGQITRDKALRLLDLVELLGGASTPGVNPSTTGASPVAGLSKFDKMRTLVQRHFPLVWFSSKEVQLMFEQENKEPIGLSTVATYLARMSGKGFIVKAGPPNSLKYRLSTNVPKVTLEQRL